MPPLNVRLSRELSFGTSEAIDSNMIASVDTPLTEGNVGIGEEHEHGSTPRHQKPSIQTGSVASFDSQPTVSIGSPRSVFVPVQSPQHSNTSGRPKGNLLPPSTDGKIGSRVSPPQGIERENEQLADLKNKPLGFRFKPIVSDEFEKDKIQVRTEYPEHTILQSKKTKERSFQ